MTQPSGQLRAQWGRVEIVDDRPRLEPHAHNRVAIDEDLPVTDHPMTKQWRSAVEHGHVDRVVPDGGHGLLLDAELQVEAGALVQRTVKDHGDVHVGQRARPAGGLRSEQVRHDDAIAGQGAAQTCAGCVVEDDGRNAVVEARHERIIAHASAGLSAACP